MSKGHVLQCKRASFTMQKSLFCFPILIFSYNEGISSGFPSVLTGFSVDCGLQDRTGCYIYKIGVEAVILNIYFV